MLSLLLFAAAAALPGSAPASAPAKPPAPPVDLPKLRAGCEGGTAADCVALGRALPAVSAEGNAALEKACARDAYDGCFLLAARAADLEDGVRDDASFIERYDRALALAEKRCLAGDADGCARLRAWYGGGTTPPPGPADPWAALAPKREMAALYRDAFKLDEKRCADGDAVACRRAGHALAGGEGAPRDPKRAAARFAQACAGGEAEGCLAALAFGLVAQGAPLAPADREALAARVWELLKARCDAGSGRACLRWFEFTPPKGDAAVALKRKIDGGLERECRALDRAACADWLAWLVKEQADPARFARAALPACAAGDAAACEEVEKRLNEMVDEQGPFSLEVLQPPAVAFIALEQARMRACQAGRLLVCKKSLYGELRVPFFAPEDDGGLRTLVTLAAARLADRCAAGEPDACLRRVSAAFEWPDALLAPERRKRALDWAARRCAAGRREGCVEFQRRRLTEGEGGDPARAEKRLQAALAAAEEPCADGDGAACYAAFLAESALTAGDGRDGSAGLQRRAERVVAAFEGGWLCRDTELPSCLVMLLHAGIASGEPDAVWKRALAFVERLPERLAPACERGEGRACLLLGFIRGGGLRTLFTRGEEPAEGQEKLRQAEALLVHFENHWGLKPDEAAGEALARRGAGLLAEACAHGETAACSMNAGVPFHDEDEEEADPQAKRARESGLAANEAACAADGGAPCRRLWARAKPPELPGRIEQACAGGDARGCLAGGWLAATGRDFTPADYARAVAVFEQACAAREGSGCRWVVIFRAQQFIEPGPESEAELLERGCQGGDLISCRALANRWLREGEKSPSQWERGRVLLDRNCTAGDAASCGTLGRAYRNGYQGFPKEPALAAPYLEKACALGDRWSCELIKAKAGGDDDDD